MEITIGQLAKKVKLTTDTIRFYEQKKLMTPAKRGENQYRYYSDIQVKELIFIRHCRDLGMSLHEIELLNQQLKDPQQSCQEVDHIIDEHLNHIEHKITRLMAFQTQLQQLKNSCQSNQTVENCQIVQTLQSNTP
ncbi:MerR family transcriptional regulator [Acinetobacter sp. HY1485]|uniref:MerR family transcriptional regulator n=1 Tax=Acinetobacter sp. HY1485 TaxID=2970918 RepID=UPI0022B97D20|nr:MerR family transcriptional regulator [Acinetobacter sp. HY1485]